MTVEAACLVPPSEGAQPVSELSGCARFRRADAFATASGSLPAGPPRRVSARPGFEADEFSALSGTGRSGTGGPARSCGRDRRAASLQEPDVRLGRRHSGASPLRLEPAVFGLLSYAARRRRQECPLKRARGLRVVSASCHGSPAVNGFAVPLRVRFAPAPVTAGRPPVSRSSIAAHGAHDGDEGHAASHEARC